MVHTLSDAGVEVCFANPGTSEMHTVFALDDRRAVRRRAVPRRGRGRRRGRRVRTHGRTTGGDAAAPRPRARQRAGPTCTTPAGRARRWSTSSATMRRTTAATTHRWSPTSARWPARCPGWVRRPSRAEDVGPDTAEAVAAAWAPPGGVATLILPADASLGRRRGARGRGASALPGRRARRRRRRGRQGAAGRRARRRAARRHGADGCRACGPRRGSPRPPARWCSPRRSSLGCSAASGGRRSRRSATSPSRPTRSSPVPSTCCSSTARPRWRSSPTPVGRARSCRRDARFTRSARTTRTSSPRWRRWSIRSPPDAVPALVAAPRCSTGSPTSRSDRATSASPSVRPCRRARSSSTSRSRRASEWPAARSLRHRTTGSALHRRSDRRRTAAGDGRGGGLPGPPGGQPAGRRQRDVHDPGAVDPGPPAPRRHHRDPVATGPTPSSRSRCSASSASCPGPRGAATLDLVRAPSSTSPRSPTAWASSRSGAHGRRAHRGAGPLDVRGRSVPHRRRPRLTSRRSGHHQNVPVRSGRCQIPAHRRVDGRVRPGRARPVGVAGSPTSVAYRRAPRQARRSRRAVRRTRAVAAEGAGGAQRRRGDAVDRPGTGTASAVPQAVDTASVACGVEVGERQ